MIAANTTSSPLKEESIYWEKQTDKMCGLHCVNAILQGPIYNEVNICPTPCLNYHQVKLSEIAKEMDEKEKKLMEALGTETKDFLLYMAVCSSSCFRSYSQQARFSQPCRRWELLDSSGRRGSTTSGEP